MFLYYLMIFTVANTKINVEQLLQIATDAGAGIMKIYNDDLITAQLAIRMTSRP